MAGMTSPNPAPKAPIGSLRALWPFVRRHSGLFMAWLLALACSSTATLSLPVAFRSMIDEGFSSGANTDRTFGFVLLVIIALALATAARYFFVTLLGERVVADLRTRLFAHLLGLDAGFFDRSRSGELISRLTADAELLRFRHHLVGAQKDLAEFGAGLAVPGAAHGLVAGKAQVEAREGTADRVGAIATWPRHQPR